MKLAFYKAFQKKATWLDWVIAIVSLGQYSHVEIVFSDGMWFSISPREEGGRFKKIMPNKDHWDFIQLYPTREQEASVRLVAYRYVGIGYDYPGAVFSVVPKTCIQDPDKIFCSEAAVNIFKEAGVCLKSLTKPPFIYPFRHKPLRDGCHYSPVKLFKEMEK